MDNYYTPVMKRQTKKILIWYVQLWVHSRTLEGRAAQYLTHFTVTEVIPGASKNLTDALAFT